MWFDPTIFILGVMAGYIGTDFIRTWNPIDGFMAALAIAGAIFNVYSSLTENRSEEANTAKAGW